MNTRGYGGTQTAAAPGLPRRPALAAAMVLAAGPWMAGGTEAQGSAQKDEAPTAEAILERAAEVQGMPAADPSAPLSLVAEMTVQFQKDGSEVWVDAKRRFLAPNFIWTELTEQLSGTRTIQAFDGARAWLKSNKEPGIRFLEGPEYQADRDRLREDVDNTQFFAEVFFLGKLKARLKNLRRLQDVEALGKQAYLIEGDAERGQGNAQEEVILRLWIEKESYYLYGARLVAPEPPVIEICFWDHQRNAHGVLVPKEVKIHYDGAAEPREVLRGLRVDFQAALKPEDFKPR